MTIAGYRKVPVSKHSLEERKKYVQDILKKEGENFKKGKKVLINLRGKNVEATIVKDKTPRETSILINMNGKEIRKDLATFYGFVGEKSQATNIDDEIKNLLLTSDKLDSQKARKELKSKVGGAGKKVSKAEFNKARKSLGKPKTTGKEFRTRLTKDGKPYKPPPF